MRRLATDHCSAADYRIKSAGACEFSRHQRNLERSGNLVNLNRFFARAESLERIGSPFYQSRRKKIIPPTRNDRESETFCIKPALVNLGSQRTLDNSSSGKVGTTAV
jgi:hypothetical protein